MTHETQSRTTRGPACTRSPFGIDGDDVRPSHPLDGWLPQRAGESSALLPWMDDLEPAQPPARTGASPRLDLGGEDDERTSAVERGLHTLDDVHLASDVAVDGRVAGETFGALQEAMGHHAASVLAGEATAAQTILGAITAAVGSPIAIAGGTMDVVDGIRELRAGDSRGSATAIQGVASVAGGASALGGLAGVGPMAAAAPLLLAGATGMEVARTGDKEVEKRGWFQDQDGNNVGASGWMADREQRVDEAVANFTGSRILGVGAGTLSGLGLMVPAAGIALVGAGAGLGSGLANGARAHEYAGTNPLASGGSHWDGITGLGRVNPVTGKQEIAARGTPEASEIGQEMADYDDARELAVERSKREHPERWATPASNNPTYGHWLSEISGKNGETR